MRNWKCDLKMRRMLLFIVAMMSLTAIVEAQTTIHTFSFGGLTRSYRLYVPANYTGATAVPLVFNLHGYTSNAMQQEFYSGMNAVADTAGFLICYPDGISNAWNSGFQPPYYGGIDDVGFISVLIDSLQAGYNVDPARVYSCGMSNGGFMSYRLACDLESRIAAIASVTGSMTTLQTNNCNPTRPMPVLEIHGTTDATVPYSASSGIISIDSVLSYWRGKNACIGTPIYDTLADISTTDLCSVTTQWYTGCSDSVEVAHYKIEGGGHTWPGAFFQIPGSNTNQDIKASVEIWRFFYRFSHPNPVLTGSVASVPVSSPIVAPQPSSGEIRVQNLEVGAELSLFSLEGQEIGQWVTDVGAFTIDAHSLAAGIYLLKINQSSHRFALKVLVTE